jgi:mannose-6-phosphate isomerase-like protein (cupin superfamily)
MTRHANLYRWDELPLEKITEMVARKVIACGDTTLTQVYFKKGAYVLQGALRGHVDRQDLTAREGEVLVVPAGASRQMESLDDTFVMTFTGRPS